MAELLACMTLLQHSPKQSLLASDKSQATASSRLTPLAPSTSEPSVQPAHDATDGNDMAGLISVHVTRQVSYNSSIFDATKSKLPHEPLASPQHSKPKCRKAASFATFAAADKGHIWSAQAMPGLMDDIKPVTKLDFVTPGLLAAHRGAAGELILSLRRVRSTCFAHLQ